MYKIRIRVVTSDVLERYSLTSRAIFQQQRQQTTTMMMMMMRDHRKLRHRHGLSLVLTEISLDSFSAAGWIKKHGGLIRDGIADEF